MAIEIERKFLVNYPAWQSIEKGTGHLYQQGYLLSDAAKTIRVRLTDNGGFLTIKGLSVGAARPEYEYVIPMQDATELLEQFCTAVVSKTRYSIQHESHRWEVDVFLGNNEGLIVAEIELEDEHESFTLPSWIGKEVTGESKYYNSSLAATPYKMWNRSPE